MECALINPYTLRITWVGEVPFYQKCFDRSQKEHLFYDTGIPIIALKQVEQCYLLLPDGCYNPCK